MEYDWVVRCGDEYWKFDDNEDGARSTLESRPTASANGTRRNDE